MRKKTWKIIIVLSVVAIFCLYYLSTWFPLIPDGLKSIFFKQEKLSFTGTEAKMLRLKKIEQLKSLPQPKLNENEVIEFLKNQKNIKTQELYDASAWYVMDGSKRVIKQLINNLRYAMIAELPEDKENNSKKTSPVIRTQGRYLPPLPPTEVVVRLFHWEFHKYAESAETEPHFIYYLARSILGKMRLTDEMRYYQQIFYDDIFAFLKIYVNYRNWPSIRELIKNNITNYPCGWSDRETIEEVLRIADSQGVEPAFELYTERYKNNYQKSYLKMKVYEKIKEYCYKFHRAESIFTGWSSEEVKCKTLVYDVDSNDAKLGMDFIKKIISVKRNGKDITPLCQLTDENIMFVPLQAQEVVEIEYIVSVTPVWWTLSRY
jgi:hypothetical protein